MGDEKRVTEMKKRFMKQFPCTDEGDMVEYVGSKTEYCQATGRLKLTQPVLIKSLEDEFPPSERSKPPDTPAIAGKVLTKSGTKLTPKEQKMLAKLVGKHLFMSWSRPEVANPVREVSRHMTEGTKEAFEQAMRIRDYLVATRQRGRIIAPQRNFNDIDRGEELIIRGISDANYATDPETRKSVTGLIVYLEDAVVASGSKGQNSPALATTEAEFFAAVAAAQAMIHAMNVVTSLGFKVKTPMILEVDNKGVVDLANGFSVGGRSKHYDVKLFYIRELKHVDLLRVIHVRGIDNQSDMLTKNLTGPLIGKHSQTMVTDETIGKG